MRKIGFLLAAALLVACGGGDGGGVTPPDTRVPRFVALDRATWVLDDGDSATLTAKVVDVDYREIPGQRVTWRSPDPAIATVDADGRLVARRPGLVDIVASIPVDSATVRVLVRQVPTALVIAGGDAQAGFAGVALGAPLRVRLVDRHGLGVPNVTVYWQADHGTFAPPSVATDAAGEATTTWTAGARTGVVEAVAGVDGLAPVRFRATIDTAPAVLVPMLQELDLYIAGARFTVERLRPLNPGMGPYIDAKLAMLADPDLRAGIQRDRRWTLGSVRSTSGALLPVAMLFALESMRGETERAVREIEAATPVVEAFMGRPFPFPSVRGLHGFTLGNSGGGGRVTMEDQASYEARTPATRLPYEAILVHEITHSWIGSEPLNQLLELYGYNVARTGSTDPATWTFTRGWVPGAPTNTGVHALLDVYQLLGRDAMSRAYHATFLLDPRFGEPVPAAVKQLFVDEAPAALKAQVAGLMERVTV